MTPSIPTAADIAAVVFPPIKAPDPLASLNVLRVWTDSNGLQSEWIDLEQMYSQPLQELEANEGICAQESDRE